MASRGIAAGGTVAAGRPPRAVVASVLLAGGISAVLAIVFSISFSAIVFGGDLRPFVSQGVGLALLGTVALGIVVPLGCTYPGTVGALIAEPAVVLGVIGGSLATHVAGPQLLPTMLVSIMVAGVTTGAGLFVVGRLELGSIGQYVPYPVIGGFLAGLGVILVQGSLSFVLPMTFSVANVRAIAADPAALRLPCVVAVGAAIWIAQRWRRSVYNIPAILLAASAVFWVAALAYGAREGALHASGWLLGPFPHGHLWTPAQNIDALRRADWLAIGDEAPKFLVIFLLVLMSALMDASSLELVVKQDIDPNRELRAIGLGNLLCGIVGGFPGTTALSATTINARMGVPYRAVGLVAAAVVAAVFVFGAALISYLPRFAVAGLLFYVGVEFLRDWLVASRARVGRLDYVIILTVFLVVALVGFMEGFGVGIVLGFIFFVVTYSKLPIIKLAATGEVRFSNVDRAERDRDYLRETGAATHVFQLQGFIFFGTVRRLLEVLRRRLADPARPRLAFLVLDFKHVNGVDSSAMVGFAKIRQYAASAGFVLVLCGADADLVRLLKQYEVWRADGADVVLQPDLDRALEWTEAARLRRRDAASGGAAAGPAGVRWDLGSAEANDRFARHLEAVSFAPGEYLCRQGDRSNDLFLIRRGQVSVLLDRRDGHPLRLRTYTQGSVIGEIAMFLDVPRSASVVADEPVEAYRMSRATFERMKRDAPAILAEFQHALLKLAASQLHDRTRFIAQLEGL